MWDWLKVSSTLMVRPLLLLSTTGLPGIYWHNYLHITVIQLECFCWLSIIQEWKKVPFDLDIDWVLLSHKNAFVILKGFLMTTITWVVRIYMVEFGLYHCQPWKKFFQWFKISFLPVSIPQSHTFRRFLWGDIALKLLQNCIKTWTPLSYFIACSQAKKYPSRLIKFDCPNLTCFLAEWNHIDRLVNSWTP